MQVQRVRLNAVKFAVDSSLGLPLVEVRLGSRLAVELLDLIRVYIEQIAMICLLVRCCKSTKDDHVVLGDLEETTALQANPVGVLLDL